MTLFEILYQAAFALDAADEFDLREAQAELDALWNEGGLTQAEMDAQMRVRGMLHDEIERSYTGR